MVEERIDDLEDRLEKLVALLILLHPEMTEEIQTICPHKRRVWRDSLVFGLSGMFCVTCDDKEY